MSAVADPFTGAIIVTPNDDGSASVVKAIGGTSLSSPVFSGIWALADQEAGTSLGQAGPIISRMPAGALRDFVPIAASKSNLSGTVGLVSSPTSYGPTALLEPSGLETERRRRHGRHDHVHHRRHRRPVRPELRHGLVADGLSGWDNAIGYNVPNGLPFVKAATAK